MLGNVTMPRKPVGLTDAKIRGIAPSLTGQAELSDNLVPGLRIRVGRSGVKTFIFRKRIGSEVRNITLGRYTVSFGLAEARKKARSLIIDINSGKGAPKPAQESGRTQTGRNTFSYLWKLYIERSVRGKKRSAPEIESVGRKFLLPDLVTGLPTRSLGQKSPTLLRTLPIVMPISQPRVKAERSISSLVHFILGPCRNWTSCPPTHAEMRVSRRLQNPESAF